MSDTVAITVVDGDAISVAVTSTSDEISVDVADGVTQAYVDAAVAASTPEGTAVKSTGETGGTKFLREDGDGTCSWQTASTPQVYPGAGIAVSTGSAWATSIADASANWNTAYGWGNHASAGYAAAGHTHTGVYQPLATPLTDIAALAATDGNIIVGNGSTWVAESGATARTSLGLGTVDSVAFAGVGVGTSSPRYTSTVVGVHGVLVSDDGTNYEGLRITSTAGSPGNVTLACVTAGTGSDNIDLVLTPAGTGKVKTAGVVDAQGGFDATNTGVTQTALVLRNTSGLIGMGVDNSSGSYYGTGTNYARVITASGAYPLYVKVNGAIVAGWTTTGVFQLSSSLDTGLARNAAGVMEVNNGTAGTLRDIRVRKIIADQATPASASATGTAGSICWDADYIYVCTATNTWKRAALSTW